MQYPINEMFQTLQGEGYAGKVTLTLQGLEHLVSRVLHSILCEVDNC